MSKFSFEHAATIYYIASLLQSGLKRNTEKAQTYVFIVLSKKIKSE